MAKIELTIDEETLSRARDLAEAHRLSLDQLIADALRRYAAEPDAGNGLIGLFADAPHLLDASVDWAMTARDHDPLRHDG